MTGAELLALRLRKGWTQKALAQALGISQTKISYWERGIDSRKRPLVNEAPPDFTRWQISFLSEALKGGPYEGFRGPQKRKRRKGGSTRGHR
jgi:DNA-binding XRE family transcriptional regulator